MKRKGITAVCCLLFAVSLPAQIMQTQNYVILYESGVQNEAESLARELELRFAVFNTLFRFDVSALAEPLKVRVFSDESAYNSYFEAKTVMKRGDAVYLHYNRAEDRELVVYRNGSSDSPQFAHQAFVQFLRGFVSNPPAWMIEGFAIYFSTLSFNRETGDLSYEENLSWLSEARRIVSPLKSVFEYAAENEVPVQQDFQVQSWALASFFLISGLEEYYRTLTECFMLLSPDGSAEDNSQAVIKHIGDWDDFDLMDMHYRLYLNARKTFAELVEEGRNAYLLGNYNYARMNFIAALEYRSDHHAPYYFLGLISYRERDYGLAEELYRRSLDFGADETLIFYALGLNAAAAGKNEDALNWLRRASSTEAARLGLQSEGLIRQLQQ